MTTRLVKHGEESALIIDAALLDQLHISFDTPLEVTSDGKSIIITPKIDAQPGQDIIDALKRVNEKYPHALKRLGE
jgi:antitoxin component of MazEF toxin-antitoxin module